MASQARPQTPMLSSKMTRLLKRLLRTASSRKALPTVTGHTDEQGEAYPTITDVSEVVIPGRSSAVNFPQEIIDLIVDEYASRPRDLANTTLVSTAWRSSALRHQLEFITIGPLSWKAFMEFLKENSKMSVYVKRLRIDSNCLSVTSLRAVLQALPGLRELQLYDQSFTCRGDERGDPIVFPTVQSLTIERSYFSEECPLMAILSLFPDLHDLYLDGAVGVVSVPESDSGVTEPHLKLDQLTLGPEDVHRAIDVARQVVASCSVLRCGALTPATFEFILLMRNSLRELELRAAWTRWWSRSPPPSLPGGFPKLRVVTLRVGNWNSLLRECINCLPDTIQEIVLELENDLSSQETNQPYDQWWWKHFDGLHIPRERFSQLDRVVVRHVVEARCVRSGPHEPIEEHLMVQEPLNEVSKEKLKQWLARDLDDLLHFDEDTCGLMRRHCTASNKHIAGCQCYHTRRKLHALAAYRQ